MSESTTKKAKTTKPSTGAESKTTKSESKSASSSTSTESKSKSSDGASSESDSTPAEKSTKGLAAADHSPSYFSSVSTPEYRSGWDSVFTSGRAKKPAAKRGNGLPVTIELDRDDLDDDMRALIEDAFRRKAKKQRIKFDQHLKKARMTWRLECEFSD